MQRRYLTSNTVLGGLSSVLSPKDRTQIAGMAATLPVIRVTKQAS
jgi:hypothetical protein